MTENEARVLRCSECSADGDDYYYDAEKDAMVKSCPTCPYNTKLKEAST